MRGWGEGRKGRYCLMDTEFLFGMMKKIWKYVVGMVAQYYDCVNATELYT